MIDVITLSTDYLKAFAAKNICMLDNMFDDNVQLNDWTLNVTGKNAVLLENQKLFNSVGEINISIKNINATALCAMIEIDINIENINLQVVDVIEYNDQGKIKHIRAYQR